MRSFYTDNTLWEKEWQKRAERRSKLKRCSVCVYDEETPNIWFDETGKCNYCHQDDMLRKQFPGGEQGKKDFEAIVAKIKKAGRKKKYDVIIGVSGGTDSTYMLHIAKEYGLRPLAVHFDNTWNSTISQENIKNALKKLDIDLWTYVVNNNEYDDLYKAFLKSGTPELDMPTDIALAAVLNMAAHKFGVQYIFEGHSFKTEGVAPLGWIYMDAKYIDDVHKKFGTMPIRSFPNFRFGKQLKWMLVNKLTKVRPLWYLDYDKAAVKKLIAEKYDWQWYGGHHLENRITAFAHTYYLSRKFDIDTRTLGFGGRIRSGQMDRQEAIERMKKEPDFDQEVFDMILKRYKYSYEEFEEIMHTPKKTYRDYKTYKRLFERLRPFFYLMAKAERIPWSFYMKYTKKDKA